MPSSVRFSGPVAVTEIHPDIRDHRADAAPGEPPRADGRSHRLRAVVHNTERSAAIGILMFVACSIALQSAVVLHSSGGNGRAEAAAVPPMRPLAQASIAGAALHLPRRVDASPSASRAAPRGDLLTDGRSVSRSAGGYADDLSTADTTIAKLSPRQPLAVAPAVALRADTFGPETSRRSAARVSSAALPTPTPLSGTTRPSGPTLAATPASFVMAPAIRSTTEEVKGPKADRAIIVDRSERVPLPRVLGRRSKTSAPLQKVHFQDDTPDRCLPGDLVGVLNDVAEKFGEVQVLSTFRDPQRNRRVGGAPQSYHLRCQAIDFRVIGRAPGLLAYLEQRPEVGGLKRYPLGFFHIDNGPRRTW